MGEIVNRIERKQSKQPEATHRIFNLLLCLCIRHNLHLPFDQEEHLPRHFILMVEIVVRVVELRLEERHNVTHKLSVLMEEVGDLLDDVTVEVENDLRREGVRKKQKPPIFS